MDLEKISHDSSLQVVVYSFVTAHARISMLEDMKWLMQQGCRIFYSDTDSIIFFCPRDKLKLVNSCLRVGSPAYGAYKSETRSPISTFVTLGPKNYAFVTKDGQSEVKTRGFTLNNAAALEVLNQDSMRDLLRSWLRGQKEFLNVMSTRIKINRKEHSLHTETFEKIYKNDNFDKRSIRLDGEKNPLPFVETAPFGAKHYAYEDVPKMYRFIHPPRADHE